MPAASPATVVRKAAARSRVTNGKDLLPGVDGRTLTAPAAVFTPLTGRAKGPQRNERFSADGPGYAKPWSLQMQ
jgi:hypothetical protein